MLKKQIITYLESLTSDEIIPIHNRYCEYNNQMDDYVYYMEDLPELIKTEGKNAREILSELKNINSNDRYLRINGLGFIESFNDWFDVFSVWDIAEYVVRTLSDLDNLNIEAIIDEYNFRDTPADDELPKEMPIHDTDDDYWGQGEY